MQSDYEKGLKKFLEFHGFKTYDYNLVETALTHSSYIYDRGLKYTACYERLEFLGDAVLKLITSEYLYRTFPEADEGKLTQIRSVIISDEVLAGIAMEINIADYIKMSESEARDGGRENKRSRGSGRKSGPGGPPSGRTGTGVGRIRKLRSHRPSAFPDEASEGGRPGEFQPDSRGVFRPPTDSDGGLCLCQSGSVCLDAGNPGRSCGRQRLVRLQQSFR